MAVQTRACNNNRQIKTKQADAGAQSGNNNLSSRRSYHRRRNRGKTIPKEFLEKARFSQAVQTTDSTETACAVAKKSKAVLDNNSVQQSLTTTATAASVKTSVSVDPSAVVTTQEIKCKKSGKMFQVGHDILLGRFCGQLFSYFDPRNISATVNHSWVL